MMCCMLPLSMMCACLYFLWMITLFAARFSCTADSSQLNNNCGRSFKFLSSMIFFNTSKYSPMISFVAFEYRPRSITCDLLSVISCPYRFRKPCRQRNDGPVDGKDEHLDLPIDIYTHTYTYTWYTYIRMFVAVDFHALPQASDIRIERRQVVFLCWMQDSNPGTLTPNRQETECPLTNWPSYQGSSLKAWTRQSVPMISDQSPTCLHTYIRIH